MWELYDALIEDIDPRLRVERALVGAWRALVESGGRAGICSLLLRDHQPEPAVGEPAGWRGRPLKDLAARCKSWDPREAALGVAALNAWHNEPERLRGSGAALFPGAGGADPGDIFTRLLPWAAGKKVAAVGHFQAVDRLYGPCCELTIFEREPRPGDLPDTAEEYLLPEMDLVFITGMALTNKTLPRLLQLCAGSRVVLAGPSAALSPLLFSFGVDVLSGLAVLDRDRCRRAVLNDDWRQIYAAGAKVILNPETAHPAPAHQKEPPAPAN